MSIFTNPHKVLSNILAFLEGPVWNFLKPFAQTLEGGASQVLITAAENAVTIGFATPGDGTVKMAAALASFSAEVAAKGVPFVESQARALIELALQKLKVSGADSASTSTAPTTTTAAAPTTTTSTAPTTTTAAAPTTTTSTAPTTTTDSAESANAAAPAVA